MTATSSVAGSTFLWSGPNSFTSTLANPTVTVPGNYLVEVTAPNNCKSNGAAQVINDTAIPSISIALGTVDCAAGTRQIIASTTSTTTGFTWTGPSGFTSNLQNPTITNVTAATILSNTISTANLSNNAMQSVVRESCQLFRELCIHDDSTSSCCSRLARTDPRGIRLGEMVVVG